MSIIELVDSNLINDEETRSVPVEKSKISDEDYGKRRSAFTVKDARKPAASCARVSAKAQTFRGDLDFVEQCHFVREARARQKYALLMEDYHRSCADATTHRIFLHILVAEGRRFQLLHYKSFKLSKPRLTATLQQKLDEVFKQEMQVHDGYVELLGDVAAMRLFDLRPRTSGRFGCRMPAV